MNRDDIILWAAEADFYADALLGGRNHADFHKVRDAHFAKLVAAAEREACLSVLRDMEGKKWHTVIHGGEMKGVSLHDAYMAICARGLK